MGRCPTAARRLRRRRVRAVGQDRRPRRRRRRARPVARPLVPGATDGLVDVFLPRYRSVPVPGRRRTGPRPLRVPGPAAPSAARSSLTIVDVAGRTATGCGSSTTRPPSIATGSTAPPAAATIADNAWRFGLFCRAALEALRADGTGRSTSSTSTTGTPARRPLFRDRWYARRPGRRPGGDRADAPQPRLPRLDAARAAAASSGLAPGDGVVAADADGIDLLRAGIERAELVEHRQPGLRRASRSRRSSGSASTATLRAKGDRFSGSSTASTRRVWDPATDADLAAPYSRRRPGAARRPAGPTCCARLGFDPADDGAGPRDDRPARSAEGLRPPRRRRARAARRAAPGSSSRAAATPSSPAGFRALAGRAPGPGRAHRAVRPGDGPPDLRRRRLLPHAVALRAVRPGPDDRAALRDAADRPPDRRPGRHGRRRATPPGRGHRVRVRRPATPDALRGGVRGGDRAPRRPAARRGTASSRAGWRSTSTG